jgi:hypothetical protein
MDHFRNLGVGKRIILKLILNKKFRRYELDSFVSGQGPVAGYWEYCSGISGFIRSSEFIY